MLQDKEDDTFENEVSFEKTIQIVVKDPLTFYELQDIVDMDADGSNEDSERTPVDKERWFMMFLIMLFVSGAFCAYKLLRPPIVEKQRIYDKQAENINRGVWKDQYEKKKKKKYIPRSKREVD